MVSAVPCTAVNQNRYEGAQTVFTALNGPVTLF